MNILFLSEMLYPHGGGAELATYLYAKYLREEGFHVVVVTNRFTGEKEYSKSKDLEIYRLPFFQNETGIKYSMLTRVDIPTSSFMKKLVEGSSVVYIPRFWYSMIPIAKIQKKPVIVHVHDYTPICPLAVFYDFSKRAICGENRSCSTKCIYQFERNKNSTIRESTLSTFFNLFFRALSKRLIKRADAILCVSKAQRETLTNHIPIIAQKTHVIYNPMPRILPLEVKGEDFGYFGGTNILKGFDVLSRALTILNDLSVRVQVTGLSTINTTVQDMYSRVGMVFSKRIEYDKQESFYEKIKAVVFPSIVSEPLPYVVAEAMLRARILIASKVGGIPEQVEGCKGAFLFEAGNYRQLAEALRYVKDLSKDTTSDLGCQNRAAFAKNFDNETTIKKFISTIDRLV